MKDFNEPMVDISVEETVELIEDCTAQVREAITAIEDLQRRNEDLEAELGNVWAGYNGMINAAEEAEIDSLVKDARIQALTDSYSLVLRNIDMDEVKYLNIIDEAMEDLKEQLEDIRAEHKK